MVDMEKINEAKKVLEDTVKLAKILYGRRWMDMLEQLEDLYEGDPFEVLDHLKREAAKRGIRMDS